MDSIKTKNTHNHSPRPTLASLRGLKAFTAMLLVVFLGSCYLPLRFDIEIDFSRRGFIR